jgi:ATP-dependent protease ClpP protease subunit
MLGSLAGLAACQAPPVDTGPHRIAFMVFRTAITPQSRDFFIAGCDKMVARDVKEIRIGISSPGGNIRAAEGMMTYMDKMHAERGITFTTFDVGLVASAACYVFLAGQKRYSIPRGAFLFHEASLRANGAVTSQTVHEAAAELDQEERRFLDILKTRTRLTEGEALSFVRRTVILNADEARRDGITDGTADFIVPNEVTPSDIRAAADTSPRPVTRPPAAQPVT